MNDDQIRRQMIGPGSGISEHPGQTDSVARMAQPQDALGLTPPPTRIVAPAPPNIRPGMTPDEIRAYIESTKQRASRQKPRPSLAKYEDLLRDLVNGKAVMKQVFDDLIAVDPAVLEEFGPEGHRAFNACVKRMFS